MQFSSDRLYKTAQPPLTVQNRTIYPGFHSFILLAILIKYDIGLICIFRFGGLIGGGVTSLDPRFWGRTRERVGSGGNTAHVPPKEMLRSARSTGLSPRSAARPRLAAVQSNQASPSHFGTPQWRVDSAEENKMTTLTQLLEYKF